jgi:ABC-2 type transport system permease protein
VQAKEATHVVTYGGDQLSSYPLDIYQGTVRRFFTFVIPFAFVNYEPALYLLDRSDPFGLPDAARLLSPLAAILIGLVARIGWQQGVLHYQSTGS